MLLAQGCSAYSSSGGPVSNNSKAQFAASPDLNAELVNAIIASLDAHTSMSTQALNSADVQRGLKDILLNHARLWETLRERASGWLS